MDEGLGCCVECYRMCPEDEIWLIFWCLICQVRLYEKYKRGIFDA
jgi:hypothetical protein